MIFFFFFLTEHHAMKPYWESGQTLEVSSVTDKLITILSTVTISMLTLLLNVKYNKVWCFLLRVG